ncbi:MAG: YaiI/YqxD family protein [Pseudomonadota bacterium]
MRIFIDADACPVKDEIYKVAFRYEVPVFVVANSYMRIPKHELIERVVVNDSADAADDWIAERCDHASVVVTADIPLADRALKAGAIVMSSTGKLFTADMIGMALATRSIMQDLRAGAVGENLGGPSAFTKADRSRFLSALDTALVKLKRERAE